MVNFLGMKVLELICTHSQLARWVFEKFLVIAAHLGDHDKNMIVSYSLVTDGKTKHRFGFYPLHIILCHKSGS
jgi:hypothetical protein